MAIVCVLCLQHPGNLAAVEGTDKITTIAGSAEVGFAGDGGPANKAKLKSPEGLFLDEKGFLYIADTGNQRIRRVGLDGIIETIAGNGDVGFSGDGGLAMAASFHNPSDVTVDSKGNIYIADIGNQRIRRVGVDGIITTFAGLGLEGGGYSGDGGPANQAQLNYPRCVAADRLGNVFIGDWINNRVRKVNPISGIITTIAGTGEGGFDGDGGPAIVAKLNLPFDIAIDGTDIYIADQDNDRIRLVDVTGTITTIAGTGIAGSSGDGGSAKVANFRNPTGVTIDSKGNVYIADNGNHRIRVVNTSRIIDTLAGSRAVGGNSGDGGPANQAHLNCPHGVTVDADGINVYFSDNQNHRVRRVGPDGILALMVTSLTFDITEVGGSSEQTLKVQNIGTGALTITEFSFSGAGRRDYQGQETLPTIDIDPGGVETITVIFSPSGEGERAATMFVKCDAGSKVCEMRRGVQRDRRDRVRRGGRSGDQPVGYHPGVGDHQGRRERRSGDDHDHKPGRTGSVHHRDHPGGGRCFGIRRLPHRSHDHTRGIGDRNDYIRSCHDRE